jgi:hypothetical protein
MSAGYRNMMMYNNVGPNLGGGIQGISPVQTNTSKRDSSDVVSRKVVVKAWNNPYAVGTVNGRGRAIGEFRAVTNTGDFLSRQHYSCGNIPTPVQPNNVAWRSRIGSIIKNCDNTGIPCSNANVKFVPDSSLYTRYKRERQAARTYNDLTFVGNNSNGSYTQILESKL